MRERIEQYIWGYDASDPAMPASPLRQFLQLVMVVARDLMEGMITLRAMSLVYTTLLSLVPMLAVSISMLKGFGVHDQLEPTLAQILAPLGEQSAEISARIVGFVENMKIGVLGALGLVMLIYTAIALIQKIEAAFNYTWRLRGSRTLVQRFSDYLSVIMVGPVLVFSAVGITASLGSNQIVEYLNALPYMNNLLRVFGKLLPFFLVIAAFTFVYMLVPNTRVKFRSALYGAVVAGVLWQIAGILFTSFVGGSSSYTAIYSGLAILLVFMIWLYLSWMILLIGASISFYHQHPEYLKWKQREIRLSARLRDQLALQAMYDIARAHNEPGETAPTLEKLAASQQVPVGALQRILDTFEADGLLQRSAGDPPVYLPGVALSRIRLLDIVRCARRAEDEYHDDSFRCDDKVARLLEELEQDLEVRLGKASLADLLRNHEGDTNDEDRLV